MVHNDLLKFIMEVTTSYLLNYLEY